MLHTKFTYEKIPSPGLTSSSGGGVRVIPSIGLPAGTSGTLAPTTVKQGTRAKYTLSQLGLGVRYLHPEAYCSVLLDVAFVEVQNKQ